jgi:hypothetical protein
MTSFAQASSDLDTTVGVYISQGAVAWNAGNYPAAVTAYQQAGQAGAQTVGPEIDSAGQPSVTQYYTQQAWNLNTALAAIPATTATQAQALEAQTLAQKILSLYKAAIVAGQQAAIPPPSNLPIWLALGGIAALGGVILGLHSRKVNARPSQRPTRRVSSSAATRRMSQAATRRV